MLDRRRLVFLIAGCALTITTTLTVALGTVTPPVLNEWETLLLATQLLYCGATLAGMGTLILNLAKSHDEELATYYKPVAAAHPALFLLPFVLLLHALTTLIHRQLIYRSESRLTVLEAEILLAEAQEEEP